MYEVEKLYQDGLNYQRKMGFTANWKEFVDFKEYRMWGAIAPGTENFPRPNIGLAPFILEHKVAVVNSRPLDIQFNPVDLAEDDPEAVKTIGLFNALAKMDLERMKLEDVTSEVVDDGGTTGTGIWHFYFDGDAYGGYSKRYIGQVNAEAIDPSCIFVSNPQEKDIQKQSKIIISYREDIERVKEQAKENGAKPEDIEKIKPDKNTA